MKVILLALALTFVSVSGNLAFAGSADNAVTATASAAMAEAKYDRLMRIYVNKLKLAFVQEEDAQTLEILNQYASLFTQQTDALKNELATLTKEMPRAEVEALYKRIANKSRSEEMVSILYDARVVGRMESNQEIRIIMDALQAKSLEIQQANMLASK
jgi:hypothetical protein